MGIFRASGSKEPIPESPALLFRDIKGKDKSIKFLWDHQAKVLDSYHTDHLDKKDIAVELPTGSGKTLVGLLIGEFRRRAKGERVVLICPNKQLCCQVESQAVNYGIKTSLLIGKQKDYDQIAFSKYQQAKTIAISTYSGVFNTNPAIDDPQTIICDDAHAADGFVGDMWTLRVDRTVSKQKEAFAKLYAAVRPIVPENFRRLIELESVSPSDRASVVLIPSILVADYFDAIREAMKMADRNNELIYSWSQISENLEACHLYCSPEVIEMRPVVPPTLSHDPFAGANQRVYMSATLGENGDIERSFGIKEIARLPMPPGWEKRGTGRRLVLFPGMTGSDPDTVFKEVIAESERCLILVPHGPAASKVKENVPTGWSTIGADSIESDLKVFTDASSVALIMANRYDGLDLPGDDCRMLAVVGLPGGISLQERYLIEGLGARTQFQDRIRTRVTQAMGRCTRDEGDYSVVLFMSPDLVKWCCTSTNVKGIHPELQAELQFGMENSENRTVEDMVELVREFLAQSDDWQEVEEDIRQKREAATKVKDATTDKLKKAARLEIDFTYSMWKGQFEDALKTAVKVTEALEGGVDLKPYRSFWYELAGQAAFHAFRQGRDKAFRETAIKHIRNAAASGGLKWANEAIRKLGGKTSTEVELPVQEWFLELNALLEKLGPLGGAFEKKMAEARECIGSTDWKRLELGLEMLGKLLGAKATRFTEEGKPDGLWQFSDWWAAVFEAKTMGPGNSGISKANVAQTALHEQTIRSDELIAKDTPCSTIVVSTRGGLHKLAVPHAGKFKYVAHAMIVKLFEEAAEAFRHVRDVAGGSSDESLRETFIEVYKERKLFMTDIKIRLEATNLNELSVVE